METTESRVLSSNRQQRGLDMNFKGDAPVLPFGDQPFWDKRRSEEERTEIKSAAESCVLLQSLRQSRERWLSNAFPKFSSKSRGNKDSVPPPHTIQTRAHCDLKIGPHIFLDTAFYEVHYLPVQASNPSNFSTQPPAANPYWQPSTSYSSSYSQSASAAQNSTAKLDEKVAPSPSSSTLTSLSTAIPLTPKLIQQVNSAASSNPILANLLQLAAAGKASQDQLQTLGLLIQSFANLESLSSTPSSQYTIQPPSTSSPLPRPLVKEFDFVLEFRESPNDKWLFPRVPVYAERKPAADSPNDLDVTLLVSIPFNFEKGAQNSEHEHAPDQYPVAFVLKKAPFEVWDTIWRWIGGEEKNEANKTAIENMTPPPRFYIGHQLTAGSQLTQFQAACAPPYMMKTLKQGPTNPNRPPRPKRPRKEADQNIASTKASGGTTIGETIVVKRARTSQSKAAASIPIQCVSCKNTDVPLILGGKYCRPCAEIEKQKASIVSAPAQTVSTTS